MLNKICAASGKEFTITDSDMAFYEKMGVPSPTLCPDERQRRRISYKNFRNLYQRKCDGTGKTIISMYHPDQPFPVYENEYWWGDTWNALDHGQDFDFSRPFFEQYLELAKKVPRYATLNMHCENCTYANMAWGSNNCYLVFGCVRDEDCLYGHIVWDSKDCLNNLYIFRCEWCSECIDCVDCYDTHFSTESANCNESYFLHDCRGCKNCFGCTNLRQKQYCFMNQQLTKEKYEEKMKQILPFTYDTIEMGKKWLEKAKKEACVFPEIFGFKNEDVGGNHVYESKNCHHAFDAKRSEDSKYLYTSYEQLNCYDISFTGYQTRFCYESIALHDSENSCFCHNVNSSVNALYSEFCVNCSDIFGCNGLRNKKYCILNKQYTKEEYETLKPKLIEHMKKHGEWGEFFPIKDSPFGYNEAIVQEYFPLTKSEATKRGWNWRLEKDETKYIGEMYQIPDLIIDVPDDVCDKVLTCEQTGRHYKIQKEELAFYKKMHLPLPKTHPDVRHEERMMLRNPRHLWDRKCTECQKEIKTSFSPDRPEKVLCEECYLKHVH